MNKELRIKKIAAAIVSAFGSPLFCIAATCVGLLLRPFGISQANAILFYILATVASAMTTKGYVFAISTTLLNAAAFVFFFLKPFNSFAVDEPTELITASIMAAVSLIVLTLIVKTRQNAVNAKIDENAAVALLNVSTKLSRSGDVSEACGVLAETVSDVFEINAACIIFNGVFVGSEGTEEFVSLHNYSGADGAENADTNREKKLKAERAEKDAKDDINQSLALNLEAGHRSNFSKEIYTRAEKAERGFFYFKGFGCYTLCGHGKIIGALAVETKNRAAMSVKDRKLLRDIVDCAARRIEEIT